MAKNIFKTILIFTSAVLINAIFFGHLSAYVMQSSRYQIQSDNITPSGGGWSSANYIFRDTLGEVSTGPSDNTSYKMRAGWQEMQETYLTVTAPSDAIMTPPIPGVSGGTAATSTAWYIITDNAAGFNMSVKTSSSPALILNGNDITHYFSDYTSNGTPTYGWNVASSAKFGFTVVPGSLGGLVSAFSDNGLACGSGSGSGNCWDGFISSSPINIISTSARTNNSPGENETITFKAQSSNNVLENGTYSATITTTVSAN